MDSTRPTFRVFVIQDAVSGEFYLRSYSKRNGLFSHDLNLALQYDTPEKADRDMPIAAANHPDRKLHVIPVRLIAEI